MISVGWDAKEFRFRKNKTVSAQMLHPTDLGF
jgi:hypothetical protein